MKKYARAWAEVAVELHNEGRSDISCTDILERVCPFAAAPEWEDSIREEICFIKGLLEGDGHEVALVNSQFFEAPPPETEEEARLLLPKSNDSSYGLHFKTGPGDLVWIAAANRQLAMGVGATTSAVERYLAGDIDADELVRAIHKLRPTSDGLRALVTKLPSERHVELLTPGV